MRIGVLGGTFNPVHAAHLQMAVCARDTLGLDLTLLMVAADPPHKDVAGHVPAKERLSMAQLACAGLAGIEASDLEVQRAGRSYTAKTLQTLHAKYPGAELFWIVGSDMLLDLPTWYRPDEVLRAEGEVSGPFEHTAVVTAGTYANAGDVTIAVARIGGAA